jgi:hypothetical protein
MAFRDIGPMQTQFGQSLANTQINAALNDSRMRLAMIENFQNRMFENYANQKAAEEAKKAGRLDQWFSFFNPISQLAGNLGSAKIMSDALSKKSTVPVVGTGVSNVGNIGTGIGGGGIGATGSSVGGGLAGNTTGGLSGPNLVLRALGK